MMTISKKLANATICAYQRIVSPFLPASCRFHPSCSEYARQSIEKHGVFRGSVRSIRRLCRCHPWNAGGYDPVD